MAALTGTQVVKLYSEGDSVRVAVYSLRNVSGNDTVDLSADFRKIVAGSVVTVTSQTQAGIGGQGTTNVAVPSGPAGDVGWLTVWGIPA